MLEQPLHAQFAQQCATGQREIDMTSRFSFSLKRLFGIVTLAALGLCVYSERTTGFGASVCVISCIGFVALSLTFSASTRDEHRSLFWRACAVFSISYGLVVLGPYIASNTVDRLRITTLPLPSTALIDFMCESPSSPPLATQPTSRRRVVDSADGRLGPDRRSRLAPKIQNPFPDSVGTVDGNGKPSTFDEKVREIESAVGLAGTNSASPSGMLTTGGGQVPEWLNRVYLAGQCWFVVLFACAFGKICVMLQPRSAG